MSKLFSAVIFGVAFSSSVAVADNLVVYTAGPKSLSSELAKAFEAKTGIKVDLFQATSGKVMARYEAEKGNPQADVLISASWGHAITLDKAGELLPYQSPNEALVPAALKTPTYVAQGSAAIAMVFNTQSGLPQPKAWADLTRPDYKGQVTMPDPSKSGSALTLVQGLVTKNSEGAWNLFSGLNENEMIVPGANKAALTPVLQGAKAVVFGAVDYIALGAKNKGETIEVIYPEDGTVLAPRPMMIAKTTKRPEMAKQFIDFVLSKEGQTMVADILILPARTDIQAKRPGYTELNIIEFDAVAATETAQKDKSRFTEIFKK